MLDYTTRKIKLVEVVTEFAGVGQAVAAPRRIVATEKERRCGGYLWLRGLEVNSTEAVPDGGVAQWGSYFSPESRLQRSSASRKDSSPWHTTKIQQTSGWCARTQGRRWRGREGERTTEATGIEEIRRQQWRLRWAISAAWGRDSHGNERGNAEEGWGYL